MIKLFRDIEIGGESGGKEDDLSKTINKGLDEAYNAGIKHSAEIVWSLKQIGWKNAGSALDAAIEQIEQLKKPTV